MRVALVNTNRMKPPIAPLGLEYVAEGLLAAGHEVSLLDLCWTDDWESAIARFFGQGDYPLVGVSLRNTDDCAFTSRQSFLADFAQMVGAIRRHTEGRIVLGGVGFSVMPEPVLASCQADAGIWGPGELPLIELAARMADGREWTDLPSLVWRGGDGWRRNPPAVPAAADLPPVRRRWVDNRRYFREGGQLGFETKRGCPGDCVYCADPLAKGSQSRLRPPQAVADELECLLDQGIDHLHTCDSEFNLPATHASAVCREIIRRNLGDRLRWYAYCAPLPFSAALAQEMRRAGCVGINFGTDSGDAAMLRRLGRAFAPEDILNAAAWSKEAGMAVMLDLLLGAPGESRESITRTIELVRRAAPDQVGVAVGVRVYAGTPLARALGQVGAGEGLIGGGGPLEPLFFLEPAVAPFVFDLLEKLIEGDRRFLFFDPARPERNYNYNANQRLVDAIRQGYRGAYWDILRRYA